MCSVQRKILNRVHLNVPIGKLLSLVLGKASRTRQWARAVRSLANSRTSNLCFEPSAALGLTSGHRHATRAPNLWSALGFLAAHGTCFVRSSAGRRRLLPRQRWRLEHPAFMAAAKRYKLASAFQGSTGQPFAWLDCAICRPPGKCQSPVHHLRFDGGARLKIRSTALKANAPNGC
jgi:hypothetical protein